MMVIITTVGTSLLTNRISKKANDCFRSLGGSTRGHIADGTLIRSSSDLDSKISLFIKGEGTANCEEYAVDDLYKVNTNASAEIKSICKIAYGNPSKVYLLCTDTFMSEFAAEKIKKALNGKEGLEFPSEPIRVENLKIDNPIEFKNAGFGNLIEELNKIFEKEKKVNGEGEIVLNISGGYKALIPFLTIYGQLKKIPIKYIYEKSDELFTLGQMPLDFDWSIAEIYYEYLIKKDLRKKELSESDIAYTYLIKSHFIDSSKELTALGKLFSDYIKKYLPQRSDVLGHYVEHKLFEAFFENEYKAGFKVDKIGREFFWDKNNREKWYSTKHKETERVEIDVQLINDSNQLIWFESKAHSKISTAIKQIKNYIEFNSKSLKATVKEVVIFIYKYDFQNINKSRFNDLVSFCQKNNVTFSLLYWDIPFNKEKGSITYKKIFETKLVLGKNLIKIEL